MAVFVPRVIVSVLKATAENIAKRLQVTSLNKLPLLITNIIRRGWLEESFNWHIYCYHYCDHHLHRILPLRKIQSR